MITRRFHIRIEGEAIIELADEVIDVVDDEWRDCLYYLITPDQIAEHIAYNLIVNRIPLSMMDGWADQPDTNAKVVEIQWDMAACEVEKEKANAQDR